MRSSDGYAHGREARRAAAAHHRGPHRPPKQDLAELNDRLLVEDAAEVAEKWLALHRSSGWSTVKMLPRCPCNGRTCQWWGCHLSPITCRPTERTFHRVVDIADSDHTREGVQLFAGAAGGIDATIDATWPSGRRGDDP